jgi:hypothetical protein
MSNKIALIIGAGPGTNGFFHYKVTFSNDVMQFGCMARAWRKIL